MKNTQSVNDKDLLNVMERGMLSIIDTNKFSFFTKKIQFFLIIFLCIIPTHTTASALLFEDNIQIQTEDLAGLINIINRPNLELSHLFNFQVTKQQEMAIEDILRASSLDKEYDQARGIDQSGASSIEVDYDLLNYGITLLDFSEKIVLTPNPDVYKGNKASWSFTTISVIIFVSIWFMISAALVIFGTK